MSGLSTLLTHGHIREVVEEGGQWTEGGRRRPNGDGIEVGKGTSVRTYGINIKRDECAFEHAQLQEGARHVL